MKTALKVHILLALALGPAALAHAQGTAFQYQGRLNYSGNPATGIYDLRFTIYDSPGGATVVAGPQALPGTGVTNGLFSVTLDFGAGVFTGPARWLEIGVRPNGGATYTNLSPRQPLLPTPYAIHASTASNVVNGSVVKSLNNLRDNVTLAAGANVTLTPSGNTLTIASTSGGTGGPWSLNGASAYYNGGNVGIGTTTPAAALEINAVSVFPLYLTAPRPVLILRDTIASNARGVIGGFDGGLRFYTESFWGGGNSSALMALDNNGNFGLGTTTPQSKLDIDVGTGQDALRMSGHTPYLTFLDTTVGYRSRIQASGGDVLLLTEGAINGTFPNAFLRLRGNGNVGIGTGAPGSKLTVLTPTTDYGLEHTDGNVRLSTFVGGSTGGGWLGTISNHKLSFFVNDGTASMTVDTTGNVGIGTATPAERLSILDFSGGNSSGLNITGLGADGVGMAIQSIGPGGHKWALVSGGVFNPFVPGIAGNFRIIDETANATRLVIAPDGNVGIGGLANPQAKLDVQGTTRTTVLTITGGADLAEPFPMKESQIDKGSVVVIDEEHPGRLKLSSRAYDRQVAGIISGANGVRPGISLHQDGTFEGGENVALTGRVYVLADAADGAIKPGDLLTTSATPGHAMKAADHSRAQGAILGKAMSDLKEGKGMVLVLVTLQ